VIGFKIQANKKPGETGLAGLDKGKNLVARQAGFWQRGVKVFFAAKAQ
jgi:hypothetical protein